MRSERQLIEAWASPKSFVRKRRGQADGFAEREAALAMLEALPEGPRVTLGAGRGCG